MTDSEPRAAGPRLTMQGVSKRFGATQALRNIDFEVLPGEVLALVGENGAGKSTLMKVLSGAHQADEGSMTLDGQPFRPRGPLDARAAGVGMIYQELSLAPHLSVMENILLGVEPCRGPLIDWTTVRQQAVAALDEIGLGELDPLTLVGELPIAKQQMVEVARAVALDCRVLVLDEPTSSLTQADIQRLFALIARLKANGISIVYISHFLEEVQEVSDRVSVLRDGLSVGTAVTADIAPEQIVALMVGREVEDLYPRSHRGDDGEVVLEVNGLSGLEFPQNASLALRRGRVLGIAGLVGAGRTELLRVLFGLDAVVSGKVQVGGSLDSPGGATPHRRWQQGVGMVSEDRKTEGLALNLSIADNITLPKLEQLGPSRFVLPRQQRKAAARWIDEVQVKCAGAAQAVDDLSGGNQQKVALARLLYADVDVLLLDEPTRGIDVGSKAQIYQLIDRLARGDATTGRRPKAILLVSSYLPELLGVCDEICVMRRGQLSTPHPVSEVDEHHLMMIATGQTDAFDDS